MKYLKNKYILIGILILTLGVTFRIFLTLNNNFLFNMDNGRDWVEVREMIELTKPRLIGHTSGIQGLYNGPGWYYFLAVPYILSNGHPYSGILLMILCWLVGGIFLLILASRYGIWAYLSAGALWIASNYVVLSTVYTFNPNPLLLLMPLFIYFLDQYLKTKRLIFSLLFWGLTGLFFNFEMAYAIFMPFVVLLVLVFSKNLKLLKTRNFWIGTIPLILSAVPQLLFELRNNFFMTNSLLNYINSGESSGPFNASHKFAEVFKTFKETIDGTLINSKVLIWSMVALSVVALVSIYRDRKKGVDTVFLTALFLILVPFLGFYLAPMTLYSWHITGSLAGAIVLLTIGIGYLSKISKIGFILAGILTVYIAYISFNNLEVSKNFNLQRERSMDASNFVNEIEAVDYVYKEANGKNFRVYTYMPSVIDYPYQFIIWWRGENKYNYLPIDYAYSPDKPAYIPNKERFVSKTQPEESDLLFLIKEPDRVGRRHLWENSFTKYPLVKSEQIGPLIIETRQYIK